MFRVDADNTIHITRGDTGVINLALKLNDEEYILAEGDVVLLTVKRTPMDKEILFQKTLENNQFTINPEDTSNLKFGTYKYDVQLTTATGIVSTVITPRNFNVEAEVTW